jgi:hypothetical protein
MATAHWISRFLYVASWCPSLPGFGITRVGLPKVQTFECRKCGLAITAEAAAEVLETAVKFMPA